MGIIAGAIDIIINATDRASRVIRRISDQFTDLGSRAERSMGIIGAIGAVAGAGLVAVAVEGTKMNATLEESEAKWTTLLKSSEKAKKQMAWIKNYAMETPFDYKSVDATATSLMGMGMSLKDVHKWMPALGDASAVLGGGADTVKGLGLALGQMNAKGKVSAEEMGQLAERGINAWQMIADGMGLSVAQVRKLSEDGKLLAKDALPLIYEGMHKTFGGGTANLMKSTVGQAMLARENFSSLAQVITAGAYNWFGANLLPTINKGLEALTSMFSGGLLAGFEKLWASSTKAKVILLALAGVLMGALIGAMVALTPAIVGAVIAFAPFLAIGLAVAGLAYTIIKYWEPIKGFFINTFGGLFTAFTNFFVGIWTLVQPIVMQMVTYLMSKFQEFGAFWNEHWGMIKQAFVNIWNGISVFIKTALSVILAIFNFIFPAVKFVVLSVFEAIKTMINGALTFIMGLIQVFAGLFTGNWSKLWEGIKNMVSGAVQFIWGYIQVFFVGKILGTLTKFASKGVSLISSFVTRSISAITRFASRVASSVGTMVSNVISAIGRWVSSMLSKVDDLVYRFISKFARMNTDVGLAMARMWEALKSLASRGVQGMINAIKGLGSTFLQAGRGLLEAFTRGVTQGIQKAKDAVSRGMAKIREYLPFSPAKKGPLSDLDKSGKSFFPTFAGGMLKTIPSVVKMASKGMSALNSELNSESAGISLTSFTGGKQQLKVVHEHKHSGNVKVNGDNNSSTMNMAMSSIKTETENVFLSDLKQVARSR